MPLIQGNAKSADAGGFYDTEISQSLRFNDDDSAYLSWTPASAGNRKTWTWSGWVKRGNLTGTDLALFGCSIDSYNRLLIIFDASDNINVQWRTAQGSTKRIETSAVYRDVSAWYHIVVKSDATQATASDRLKLYVNGEEVTAFSADSRADYTQNADTAINSTYAHTIGEYAGGMRLDGYLAEVNFIDGTALDATSFGEFKSGVWIPKAYSGSYGTNGFYLPLTSDANDDSGNGNNFTANNIASTDYVLDSPTNNFATLNPLGGSPLLSNATFSEGNLKYTSSDAYDTALSTIGMTTGKWYFETHLDSAGTQDVGVRATPDEYDTNYLGQSGNGGIGYYRNTSSVLNNGSSTSTFSATTGDIIQVALDADNGYIWFGVNNSWYGTVDTSTGRFTLATTDTNPTFFFAQGYRDSRVSNFGQDSSFAGNKTAQGNTDANGYGDFYYAPPSGYLALCTANLPDPVESIDPAQDGSPQDHFNTVLYTGDGASSHAITGVGFQPDFTWTKNRNSIYGHILFDAVRGVTKRLSTDLTNAEGTYSGITSFDADGYTLGSDVNTNRSGYTYVAWNWKANGSGVTNTDGSITSTVSANTDAGFSIVSYTGTGSVATVGHGLSSAPDVIISKSRDGAKNWGVYHESLTANKVLLLNGTSAMLDTTTPYNDTEPTSSVFTVQSSITTNSSGDNYIAYCFHSVDGFSKFGKYTGNGSTDGPFVYTGFRPAFVMFKRTDSTGNWIIGDTARNTYNVIDKRLYPDSSAAEPSSIALVDNLSNGFKLRNTANPNDSGGTYIYMAFAENPFKYANAR